MIGEIICVGTELLLGDILNTNAQFLSQELASLGIGVYHQNVVGDNEKRLLEVIELADSRSDLIILIGGLGPTSDDITKEVVAKAYNKNIVLSEDVLSRIENYFLKRNVKMTDNNKKTAYIIEGTELFDNHNGTAPGILLDENGKRVILLPGPPNELIPMFKSLVRPYLQKESNQKVISRTLKLVGIGESEAAYRIQDLIMNSTNPTVAPYAKLSEVHLRITACEDEEVKVVNLLDQTESIIRKELGGYIFTSQDETLEEVIVKNLLDKNMKISTAESITGGLIASNLISCDGASKVIDEGFITYSNGSKSERLGVLETTLQAHGAVSEEVAREMAVGVMKASKADIGLSITGIAGPTGGTDTKPVGLVYMGLANKENVWVRKFELMGDRDTIRNNAAKKALIFVYDFIEGKNL